MRILILAMSVLMAACATSESGSDALLIETVSQGLPLGGANCIVKTNSSIWQLTTPGSIMVGQADGDLRIVCEKPGYRTAELTYRMPGHYGRPGVGLGVAGGSGGVGVGLGMSFPVGKRLAAYPDHFTVEMNRL